MNKVISGLLILSMIIVTGCTANYIEETDSGNSDATNEDSNNQQVSEKTFTISGVDKLQEISSEQPVRLVISGVRNEVIVTPGTTVNSIIVSGTDITINLPEGSNPEITDSGVRTSITYS